MSPTRLLSALLTGLLIAAAATGCRKVGHRTSTVSTVPDTLIAGTVIRSAGSWSAITSKGSCKLDISVSGNSVKWTINSEEDGGKFGSTSASGMALVSPSDPWFVFVESPFRLWMCNGTSELSYKFGNPGGGGSGGLSIYDSKLQSDGPPVPSGLVPHLPPDLRKLLPPVQAVPERPSI